MAQRLIAAIIPLAFAAQAFAQQSLEQPKLPHDGKGVDFSQPYLNDLLLRAEPLTEAAEVGDRDKRFNREPNWDAWRRPLDPGDSRFSLKRAPPAANHPNAQN